MFKFKLDALHSVRKRNKDIEFKKWSQLLGELEILLKNKDKINNEYKINKLNYEKNISEGKNEEALMTRLFLDSFKHKFLNVDKKIYDCQERIEKQRGKMRFVSQQFEIIEKLKDKKFAEYKTEQEEKEKKMYDELNIMRSKRGKKFGSI